MEPDLTFPYLCRRDSFRRYADVSYAGWKREHGTFRTQTQRKSDGQKGGQRLNQNFVEYVKSHIKEYLPMEYQNAVVSINEVTKSNDRLLTGLTILSPGERSAPTIYLEALAEQVEQGLSLDAAMKQIAQIQVENHNRVPLDISVLENYEAIRPMLAVQMCDPETNQEYLKGKPYTSCGDLAAYYRIQVAANEEGTASVAITESMIQMWGITKEQLHKDAVQAANARSPVCLYDMEEVMAESIFSVKPENLFNREEPLDIGMIPIYILTNQEKLNGASVSVQDGVLEKVAELLGTNFYVLPSSIHELLILPDNGSMQLSELEAMVREVNATQIAPEDRLSDKVQYYDREAKLLQRGQEKSVLGRLSDKKAQIQQADHTAPKQPHRSEVSL